MQSGFTYAADLNEVFHLESGKIRRRMNASLLTIQTGITPILLQPVGDGFLHKPLPFYEEKNAPTILEVFPNLHNWLGSFYALLALCYSLVQLFVNQRVQFIDSFYKTGTYESLHILARYKLYA